MKSIYVIILSVFIFSSFTSSAQGDETFKKNNYLWDVSANGGLSLLWGDANSNGNPLERWFSKEVTITYGITVKRKLTDAFQLQFAFQNGTLKGERAEWSGDVYHPVIKAHTNYFDYHLGLNVDLTSLFGAKPDRLISAYMFGGFGMVHYDAESFGDDVLLHTAKDVSMMIPWGGGLRLRLNERWSLYGETNFRHAFKDNVDAYVGSGSETKDIYSITGIGITYKFGPKKEKKPKVEITPIETVDTTIAEINMPEEIAYSSNIPKTVESNSEYPVLTTIKKGDIEGVAVYEFSIPEDIYISELNVENAKVDQDSVRVKIKWDNVPAGDLNIAYKLSTGGLEKESYIVSGSFSYVEDGNDKKKIFSDRLSLKSNVVATNANANANANETKKTEGANVTNDSKAVVGVVAVKPTVVSGIEYRVQVAAVFGGTTSKRMLQRKLKLADEIKEDPYKNSYRYTVGSFKSYGEAAQHAALTSVNGAYVVAFKDGKYIGQLEKTNEDIMDKDGLFANGTTYKIQLSASKGRPYPISRLAYKYGMNENKIMEDKTSTGWYQYSIGKYQSIDDAKTYLKEVKVKVSNAYIIKFEDGKRIKR